MEQINKELTTLQKEVEIEKLTKLNVLRDIELALLKSQNSGMIISDEVFNVIKEVEKTYEEYQGREKLTSEHMDKCNGCSLCE